VDQVVRTRDVRVQVIPPRLRVEFADGGTGDDPDREDDGVDVAERLEGLVDDRGRLVGVADVALPHLVAVAEFVQQGLRLGLGRVVRESDGAARVGHLAGHRSP
jgi:hypothetical protein